MKKLFILTITCLALLSACNTKEKKDPADLSDLPKSDTLKIDSKADRDMLIILSIMPDSITTNWKWTKQERYDLRTSAEQNNYYVDTTLENGIFTKFTNDYIKTQTSKGTFELAAYRIGDGHYAILTLEKTSKKQYFSTYELIKVIARPMSEKDIVGDYSQHFLKDTTDQACQKIFTDRSVFDYDITEKGKVHIDLKEEFAKKNKDCLRGTSITLKFSELVRPFQLENID